MFEETHKLDKYGQCPVCSNSWDGGSIAEDLIKQKADGVAYLQDKSDEIIYSIVKDDFGNEEARYSKLKIIGNDAKCSYCLTVFNNHVIK